MERRDLLAAGMVAWAGSFAGCADTPAKPAAAPAAAPPLPGAALHRLAFGSYTFELLHTVALAKHFQMSFGPGRITYFSCCGSSRQVS